MTKAGGALTRSYQRDAFVEQILFSKKSTSSNRTTEILEESVKKELSSSANIQNAGVVDVRSKEIKEKIGLADIQQNLNLTERSSNAIKQVADKENGSVGKLPLNLISSPSYNKELATFAPLYRETSKWIAFVDVIGLAGESAVKDLSLGSNRTLGGGVGTGVTFMKGPWRFSGGLNFMAQAYDNLYIRERSKIYGFGLNTFENELNYRTLIYLEMPFYAGFVIKKQTIQVGIVPAFLDGTIMNYKYKTDDAIDQKTNVFGERKGLNSFGVKPTVGYMYQLNRSWFLGANVQIQMLSPLKQNTFDGEATKLPFNGQVYIRKSISLK